MAGDDKAEKKSNVVLGYACDDTGAMSPIFKSDGYRGKIYPTPLEAKAASPHASKMLKKATRPLPEIPPEDPNAEEIVLAPPAVAVEAPVVHKKTHDRPPVIKRAKVDPSEGSSRDRVLAFLASDEWQATKEKGMRVAFEAYQGWIKEKGSVPMAWNTFRSQAGIILSKKEA